MSDWKPSAWMPFYIGDYLADTQHLNTQQHGAYFLLLCAAWNRGGSLPADEEVLRVVTRLSTKEWKAHRAVLLDFFTLEDGRWLQKRLSKEMAKAISTTHRRKEAGANGAARRWRGDGKRDGKGNGPAMTNGVANGSQIDANSELTTHTPHKNHPEVVPREAGDERAMWVVRLNGYAKSAFWRENHWGPPPDKPGCLAPADLVDEWRKSRGIGQPA